MFGSIIKSLREEKCLTQKSMAEEIKININTLASYEKGTREPNFETLIKLADYFGCSTNYLLGVSTARNAERVKAINISVKNIEKSLNEMIKHNSELVDDIDAIISLIEGVLCLNEDIQIKKAMLSAISSIVMVFYDLMEMDDKNISENEVIMKKLVALSAVQSLNNFFENKYNKIYPQQNYSFDKLRNFVQQRTEEVKKNAKTQK
ncbi:MAG: helix-turn-helix domain-containing protein [Firmicutes bacterium]|nr:helix-turn-helix domain-containing protein [Bacillota bacterium]